MQHIVKHYTQCYVLFTLYDPKTFSVVIDKQNTNCNHVQ